MRISAIFWPKENSTKMAQHIFQLFMAERVTHAEINRARSDSIELSAVYLDIVIYKNMYSEKGTK